MQKTSTVALEHITKNRINRFGSMGESYDEVVSKILDVAEQDTEFKEKLERIRLNDV